MLQFWSPPNSARAALSRRCFLSAGGAGLLGLSVPRLLHAESAAAAPSPRARSVIFLYLFGGPSQLETFDLKPDAPDAIRGPFRPIASRTPGLHICQHLPLLAQRSDRYCIVRTVSHSYNDHSTAAHYIQTGHPWHVPIGQGFNATDADWPALGSVVEYVDQQAATPRDIPSYVYLPNRLGHLQTYTTRLDRPGQYAGWLGRGYDPLATDIRKRDDKDNPFYRDCDDQELDFRIHGLAEAVHLAPQRLSQRAALWQQFDAQRRRLDDPASLATFDRFQQRAFALVTSPRVRAALDIHQEPTDLRDRYGRHLFGQSTLLARRLVEAGARFVTVGWDAPDGYGWDSHEHSDDVRQHLLPKFDQTCSALLDDLAQRHLLDETLVVAVGEMGRTPRATGNWGRGHWSTLFPALLAGGGIQGGIAYGRSDRDAAYPLDHPVRPEDLAATLLHLLGIDPEMRVAHPSGRPTAVVDAGRVLHDILA